MPVKNPFFSSYGQKSEQNLLQSLVSEAIRIHGVPVYYLPRTQTNTDAVFTETNISDFNEAYPIAMYINNPEEGFGGSGDMLTQFGLEIEDTIEFLVSKSDFETNVPNQVDNRPHEGDIIFLPFAGINRVFEIKFVEDERPFYQLGAGYVYLLRCILFTYSGERFNTGIPEIDDIERRNAPTVEIYLDTGSGDFIIDERVIQPSSNVSAQVSFWDAKTKVVKLQNLTGEIVNTDFIVGQTSGANYSILSFDNFDFPQDSESQSEDFEDLGDEIEDWDETNPFGSW